MSSAWIFQDPKQVKKYGKKLAAHYVGWIDPDGTRRSKSCGSGSAGQKAANAFKRQKEGELFAIQNLNYKPQQKIVQSWKEFTKELEEDYYPQLKLDHLEMIRFAVKKWEELVKPVRVLAVTTKNVDKYISRRSKQTVKRTEDFVSDAQINKELRCLKLVFKKAKEWKHIEEMPRIAFKKEPEKIKLYVTPEDFEKMYDACEFATAPRLQGFSPADFWRAMLVFSVMTGWRISEILALPKTDLDLEAGTSVTRHSDNKGRRDEVVALHPVVVDHLRLIVGFFDKVFPWNRTNKAMYRQFFLIQERAGLTKCGEKTGVHEHSAKCGCYGFHDLRRAFATENADRLTEVALQRLMRHKSFSTTKRYINQAKQLKPLLETGIYVPPILNRKKAK